MHTSMEEVSEEEILVGEETIGLKVHRSGVVRLCSPVFSL